MKTTAILVLSVVLFSGCKEECSCERQPDNDYIVFGDYHGLCADDCVDIFKIENGGLYEDTSNQYPPGNAPFEGVFVPLSLTQYNLVMDLPDYIPARLLDEDDTIIGIPDAYDQGGYYLEIKESNEVRFWLIDSDKQNIPNYLHPLVDTLGSYVNKLK